MVGPFGFDLAGADRGSSVQHCSKVLLRGETKRSPGKNVLLVRSVNGAGFVSSEETHIKINFALAQDYQIPASAIRSPIGCSSTCGSYFRSSSTLPTTRASGRS